MMRRNLIVTYRQHKSNSVCLSELNHRLLMLNDHTSSCLNITNNHVDFYCSWLPYGGQSIRDTEIGINSSVAEAIGLSEGSIVSCKLIDDLQSLEAVHVSATNPKDWEMIEASRYRIQNTLLDQTKIVNLNQKLVVWINNTIQITIKIDKLLPDVKYGKIAQSTELVVAPSGEKVHKNTKINPPNKIETNGVDKKNRVNDSLYQRLYNKNTKHPNIQPKTPSVKLDGIIDSRTLDNVSNKSSSVDDDSSESDDTIYNEQHIEHTPKKVINEGNLCDRRAKMKFNLQIRLFDTVLTELKNQDRKMYKFRAIPRTWGTSQMCDVYLTKHHTPKELDYNSIYILSCDTVNENDDRITKEYYVNVLPSSETDNSTNSIYPSIEINDVLMAKLKLSKFSRVNLSNKKTVLNFFEKIEMIPTSALITNRKQEIMEDFKRIIINRSHSAPLLINQDQIFKLCGGTVMITVKIFPESFRYCLCDAEILRENKLFFSEQNKDIANILNAADELTASNKLSSLDESSSFIHIMASMKIVDSCVESIALKNCLSGKSRLRKSNNYLITGSQSTGKTTVCKKIVENLEKDPFNCHIETFHCTQNKARKVESIQKDLRNILGKCVERAPSILLLENLDALAKSPNEHSQNGEYYNQVSEIIKHLISTYTENTSVSVIATVANINHLNTRLYTSRGNHLFGKIYKISDMSKENRKKVIQALCQKSQLKCQNIDYDKFAILTEGYTVGFLLQFLDRAIFYAHRNDNKFPVLTNQVLVESLKTTNSYCLQGIKNNFNESIAVEKTINPFPGLESAVSVFEEVLMWPIKHAHIFNQSPLRNQAGILLFGAPGTGKTHLVTQLSNIWNLRMISVKGPELLAKFIGQSEENVRNLFERARSAKPCVLFFDEFDSIAPRRGHDSTGVTDRVVNQLLTELDGVEELKGVVVVAATSRPDLLDPALLRSGRIDRLVQCDFPDSEARLNIFTSISALSSLKLHPDVDFGVFCDNKTQNYTGADIKSILVSANMNAVKETIANGSKQTIPDVIAISQKHLTEAFNNTSPSLCYADIIKYRTLYAKFLNHEETSRNFISQRATLA